MYNHKPPVVSLFSKIEMHVPNRFMYHYAHSCIMSPPTKCSSKHYRITESHPRVVWLWRESQADSGIKNCLAWLQCYLSIRLTLKRELCIWPLWKGQPDRCLREMKDRQTPLPPCLTLERVQLTVTFFCVPLYFLLPRMKQNFVMKVSFDRHNVCVIYIAL